jgi:hypothetical protein
MRSLALLFIFACAAPATSAADPPKADPVRMNIEVSASDAPAQWGRAEALLAKCAPLDATVWYPLGSARVRATPEKTGCRVDVETEVEGGRRGWTCALGAGATWGWDFVTEAGKPRQLPPRDLPANLAAKCR